MATIKITDGLRHDQDLEQLEIRKLGVWNTFATIADIPSGFTISTITSNTNASYGVLYLVDTTLGNITLTLPTAIGNSGKVIYIKNIGNNQVNIVTTLSQTIDSNLTLDIKYKNTYLELLSTGTNFIIR